MNGYAIILLKFGQQFSQPHRIEVGIVNQCNDFRVFFRPNQLIELSIARFQLADFLAVLLSFSLMSFKFLVLAYLRQ